jgi:hypothetical protein
MPAHRLIVLFAVLPVLAACESGDVARTNIVNDERDMFVYRVPRDRIVAEATQLLAERGHTIAAADPTTLTTNVVADGHGLSTKYIVKMIPASSGMLVHIMDVLVESDGHVTSDRRHSELEWELIQRLEPDRAIKITEHADDVRDDLREHNHH